MSSHVRNAAVLIALTAGFIAPPALAIDGLTISGATYQEEVAEGMAMQASAEPIEPGLPTAVQISDSSAHVDYVVKGENGSGIEWKVRLRDLDRTHERIDDIYQLGLALPLPVDEAGNLAFTPRQWKIKIREGTPGSSVPLIYGGENVVLKRNVTLETQLLPGLVGPGGDQLPDLRGTGYGYTLWDTILGYDPSYGERVQAFANLRYSTGTDVVAPDASDERLKAYILVWIPTLDPSVPPFAIRMDITDPD